MRTEGLVSHRSAVGVRWEHRKASGVQGDNEASCISPVPSIKSYYFLSCCSYKHLFHSQSWCKCFHGEHVDERVPAHNNVRHTTCWKHLQYLPLSKLITGLVFITLAQLVQLRLSSARRSFLSTSRPRQSRLICFSSCSCGDSRVSIGSLCLSDLSAIIPSSSTPALSKKYDTWSSFH